MAEEQQGILVGKADDGAEFFSDMADGNLLPIWTGIALPIRPAINPQRFSLSRWLAIESLPKYNNSIHVELFFKFPDTIEDLLERRRRSMMAEGTSLTRWRPLTFSGRLMTTLRLFWLGCPQPSMWLMAVWSNGASVSMCQTTPQSVSVDIESAGQIRRFTKIVTVT